MEKTTLRISHHNGRVKLIDGETYAPVARMELVREDEDYARRIVACVNALQGIPTEALENGAVAKLLTVFNRLYDFASEMVERHGEEGDGTLSDNDHGYWQQHVGGAASHILQKIGYPFSKSS